MKSIETLCLFLVVFLSIGFDDSNGLGKREMKEIEKVFEVTDLAYSPVLVSKEDNLELPSKIKGENLFRLLTKNDLLGYAFVGQAPSKTAKFDYLVVFDNQLKVIHTKVMIYREEYGGEIGSKRWLKQFLGKSSSDRVKAGENIDVISGATISVNSMTSAMDNLFQTVDILKKKGIL